MIAWDCEQGLQRNYSLELLILDGNSLGASGAASLSFALETVDCPLLSLSLKVLHSTSAIRDLTTLHTGKFNWHKRRDCAGNGAQEEPSSGLFGCALSHRIHMP